MRKSIPKPPFMRGGVVKAGDSTVRNAHGFPLKSNGTVDNVAMAAEVKVYETLVLSLKKSNHTPKKAKRKK